MNYHCPISGNWTFGNLPLTGRYELGKASRILRC